MTLRIQLKAILMQQLIVIPANVTIGCMVKAEDKEKVAFAARLNEVCDDMNVPPKGRGRQTVLKDIVDLSQNAVLKWLEGTGYPSLDNARQIAVWAGVSIEWLLTGRGPKVPIYGPLNSATQLHQGEQQPDDYITQRAVAAAVSERERELSIQLQELARIWMQLPPPQRTTALENLRSAVSSPSAGNAELSHTDQVPNPTNPDGISSDNPIRQRDGSIDLWKNIQDAKKKTPSGKPGAAK